MMRRVLVLIAILLAVPTIAWAADSHLTTQDAGKLIDTHTVTNGEPATVHRQGITICDPSSNTCATITSGSGGTGLAVTVQNGITVTGDLANNATDVSTKQAILPCVVAATLPTVTDAKLSPCYVGTDGAQWVKVKENGLSSHLLDSASTTNLTSVTATATVLYSFTCENSSTTDDVFLLLYNKASAPVLASDTPIKKYAIPIASVAGAWGGVSPNLGPDGIGFSTGLAYSVKAVSTNTDTTAIAAAVLCNFEYR